MDTGRILHVVPVGDLIEHDDSGTRDCVCGPATQPVPGDDGSMGRLILHHSLDGRRRRLPRPG